MIEIKKLNKAFKENIIFHDFDCNIPDGSLIAIMGPSGSGKTTLLNMIGLLDLDYTGEILYDDKKITNEKEIVKYIRKNVNYLFQNYALVEEETVKYNLLLALEYEKMSKQQKQEKIKEVLKIVNLDDYQNKKIYTLSGGEQQRIALARTMLKKGNIILADEPTGNLDSENAKVVMTLLKKLQMEGKTIIVVTHDIEIANSCDKIINL